MNFIDMFSSGSLFCVSVVVGGGGGYSKDYFSARDVSLF